MKIQVSSFILALIFGLAQAFIGEDGIEATACVREDYQEVMTDLPNTVYLGLFRHNPNEVGEKTPIKIKNKTYTMITRAIHPPIYEIPNFLTDSECDKIISLAEYKGLQISPLLTIPKWKALMNFYFSHNTQDVDRVSSQTWLPLHDCPGEEEISLQIQERLAELTKIPKRLIEQSENMQVVKYWKGNHYHAHYDSSYYDSNMERIMKRKKFKKLPCCHQHTCKSLRTFCCVQCSNLQNCDECWFVKALRPRNSYGHILTRKAKKEGETRYITVMYYLNDVEEGGETAFIRAKVNKKRYYYSTLYNLSKYCSNATVRVRPKKGTAVLWYNNEIDPKTGWIGDTNYYSCHGGCDVIKGVKWIANNWLNVPKYHTRHYSSLYRRRLKKCPSFWSKIFNWNTYINPVLSFLSNIYNIFADVKKNCFVSNN